MTRYEKIIHDAEKLASEMPESERYAFKCGYFKNEIRHLCEEIDVLWAHQDDNGMVTP